MARKFGGVPGASQSNDETMPPTDVCGRRLPYAFGAKADISWLTKRACLVENDPKATFVLQGDL
jgi:hypothetical protein